MTHLPSPTPWAAEPPRIAERVPEGTLPAHRLPLENGWSLWRRFFLRSAGFPATLVDPLVCPESAAVADAHGAGPALEAALTKENVETSTWLRALARDGALREAVTWQNPEVVRTALDPLAGRAADDRRSSVRRKERLLTRYVLRYAWKNDTIGFFGPQAWGEFAEGASAVHHGPALVRKRQVFWEHWAIEALIDALCTDRRLRLELRPMLSPMVRIDGATLVVPGAPPLPLDDAQKALLEGADGEHVARELLGADANAAPSALELWLEAMAAKGIVRWRPAVPNVDLRPEAWLRFALEQIADPAVRKSALETLGRLDQERRILAAHGGGAAELERCLGWLGSSFERITGRTGQRSPGQVYAGRTLVFEECTRHVDATFSRRVVAEIAPALSLVLESARWYTSQVAAGYRAALRDVVRSAVGDGALPLPLFLGLARPLFPILQGGGFPPVVESAAAELRRRWGALLALPAGERRVARTSRELAARAAETFAAPAPGWPTARFHSPDLMFAASSVAAMDEGAYLAVLGEVHAGLNTLETPIVRESHPDPVAFLEALETDVPEPRVAPSIPKARVNRAAIVSFARTTYDWFLDGTPSFRPKSQWLRTADLEVVATASSFRVRERGDVSSGGRSWDGIAFLDTIVALQSASAFGILPTADHRPRVTLDKLVVARETWRFDRAAIPFHEAQPEAVRFAQARAWARARGLPRRCFYKVPTEQKPLCVDFAAPSTVDVLAGLLRTAPTATFSEMLPEPDALWLRDADGQAYTSELRVVAVDPVPFRDPS